MRYAKAQRRARRLRCGVALDWPKKEESDVFGEYVENFPEQSQIFDLIEFLYEHAALPNAFSYHGFFRHDHFDYDQDAGRAKFTTDINRLFGRRGLAFELVDGEINRIAPTGLQEALGSTVFRSGDAQLDGLLETAREKFLNRLQPSVRNGSKNSGMLGNG